MSLRGLKHLHTRRGYLSVLATALIFLNPVMCSNGRLDQQTKQCCASRHCPIGHSPKTPDCCKFRLFAGAQYILTAAKVTSPQRTVPLLAQSSLVFSAGAVAHAIRVPAPARRDHSPPELYTLFCSYLI